MPPPALADSSRSAWRSRLPRAGWARRRRLPCLARRATRPASRKPGRVAGETGGILEGFARAPGRRARRARAAGPGRVPSHRQPRQRLPGEHRARAGFPADFLADVRGAIADMPAAVQRAGRHVRRRVVRRRSRRNRLHGHVPRAGRAPRPAAIFALSGFVFQNTK